MGPAKSGRKDPKESVKLQSSESAIRNTERARIPAAPSFHRALAVVVADLTKRFLKAVSPGLGGGPGIEAARFVGVADEGALALVIALVEQGLETPRPRRRRRRGRPGGSGGPALRVVAHGFGFE